MSKTFEVIFKEFADSDTFVMSRALLEDYKRKAAQDERERIIKLLEEHQPLLETKGASERDLQAFAYATRIFRVQLIALIKGENK